MTPTAPLDVALTALLRIRRKADEDESPESIAAKALKDIERLAEEWACEQKD